MAVGGQQIAVNGLEKSLRTSRVGIRERGTSRHRRDAKVVQLPRFCQRGRGYLAKRVKAHQDSIQHHDQVMPAIKALHIALTTAFAAHTKNFVLVEEF
jgi:hypothetical protein